MDRENSELFGEHFELFKMADRQHEMSLEENRLGSFANWPFQDEGQEGICTAKRVRCFNYFLKR